MKVESRRVRRQLARELKEPFKPLYNGLVPATYEETYGIGRERFSNKFVTFEAIEVAEEAKKGFFQKMKDKFRGKKKKLKESK